MKKIIYIISLLLIIFVFNIFFYIWNDNYNFFIKNLKHGEKILDEKIYDINDNNNILDKLPDNSCECNCDKIVLDKCENIIWNEVINEVLQQEEILLNKLEEKEEVDITESYSGEINKILSYFSKTKLNLKKYDEYNEIFWITNEYSNEYITYTNENIELYIFPWAWFDDVYNFFDILSTDLKYTLNKTNNFWDKSFFINGFDEKIKIIVESENILFWLKIKKDYYNEVKKILNNIKK